MASKLLVFTVMARGWESKSVESQKEDGTDSPEFRGPPTREERDLERKRKSLELDRTRVRQEIQASSSPARKANLENAMKFLDGKLDDL